MSGRADPPFEPHRRRPTVISPGIRAELDQTMEWWDRLYQDLVQKAFVSEPYDPEQHEGHELIEMRSFVGPIRTACTQCSTRLVPRNTPV